MSPLISAIISITLSVAAQFSLKVGVSNAEIKGLLAEPLGLRSIISIFTDKYVFFGFLLYGLGAIVWLGVISKWDVSKAYPMVGLGFVFSVAIGFLIGEGVTPQRFFGVALICAGVFLVGRS
jgi:drug/metabolite transporter (DMT)-like permease